MNAKEDFPKTEFKYVGTRPIRPDGVDKVTGRAKYGADLNVQGQIYGHIVRSPHAHARIKSIDFSEALKLPGVLATCCADDLPDPGEKTIDAGELHIHLKHYSPVCMARGKVIYHAQAVAAVAATSASLAAEAAELVRVEYEVLPHVLDPHEAMKEDAPLIHEDNFTQGLDPVPTKPSNLAAHIVMEKGDLDAGFAAADVVVERTYKVPMAHQGYIEPHACVVQVGTDGKVDIWACTQSEFMIRGYTAGLTGIDVGDIRVTASEIGGGFGGKTTLYLEPVAVVLAKKSGRPVKMVMSREEVFRATGPAPSGETRVKIGAKKDGTITAFETDCIIESGAFPGHEIMPATMFPTVCYNSENARSIGRDVLTNKPRVYGYRAPGMSQPNLAVECVVNEVAEQLGMDPIDFRLHNAVDEGDVTIFGLPFMQIGLKTALEAAKNHPHYQSELAAGHGRGVAAAFWINAGMRSSATVQLSEDGSVNVLTGNPDIGGSRASMALLAAEVLDIPVEQINPLVVGTEAVGFSDGAQGSRTTVATGGAVMMAAEKLVAELKQRAALTWGIEADKVEWRDGTAIGETEEQRLTLAQIAATAYHTGGGLTFTASHNAHNNAPTFVVNICDAIVDPDTGKTTITRFTCFQDAGKAVHPSYVEGQMQGGSVQGIGWALNEEMMFNDDGSLDNAGFLDYRMPVMSDLPMIDAVIIEVPNPLHPFGVRGVGECNICAPMPAVATAVFQSAGVRVLDLPLTPPKVLAAIDAGQPGEAA